MTEVDTHNTQQGPSVLLPASRVVVFSYDQETLQTAQNIQADWRFARVGIETHEGDVEAAISYFSQNSSSDLVIIQTDTIDGGFGDRLGGLAEHCDEGTSAVVIGPDNDVNLYRQLIDMGVSDYLVRPVAQDVLAEVISKSLIEKLGVMGSELIAVLGGKGGVGASIVSEALACGVADIAGQKILLLDTAGGWSSLAVGLGFEPSTTLAEAAKAAEAGDEDSLSRMLHSASEHLSVLATGGDVMLDHTIDPAQLETLIDRVMARYPYVIADLSQSPEVLQKTVISRASKILIVSTPTLPALRLSRSLVHEIKDLRGDSEAGIDLLINMQGMAAKNELKKADIEAAMEMKVSGFLPFNAPAFLGNESESKKLTEDKEARAMIETVLLPLLDVGADSAASKSADDGGLLGGLMSKLSAKG